MTVWINDCLNKWLTEWMTDWMNDCVDSRIGLDWSNEWIDEWIPNLVQRGYFESICVSSLSLVHVVAKCQDDLQSGFELGAFGELSAGLLDAGDFGSRDVDALREGLLVEQRLQSLLVMNDSRHLKQESASSGRCYRLKTGRKRKWKGVSRPGVMILEAAAQQNHVVSRCRTLTYFQKWLVLCEFISANSTNCYFFYKI